MSFSLTGAKTLESMGLLSSWCVPEHELTTNSITQVPPLAVLVSDGSDTSKTPVRNKQSPRSIGGVNKLIDLGLCLFLTGVPDVTEPSDTSTANGNGGTCMVGFMYGSCSSELFQCQQESVRSCV